MEKHYSQLAEIGQKYKVPQEARIEYENYFKNHIEETLFDKLKKLFSTVKN